MTDISNNELADLGGARLKRKACCQKQNPVKKNAVLIAIVSIFQFIKQTWTHRDLETGAGD